MSPPSFVDRLFRKKSSKVSAALDTKLKRCLNVFDITLLGVGHMIGAGIYVLVGTALKNIAGPAVVISFALAGFAAFLSALCYAEFGARFPRAGSAYTYAYVGVGELWAFIIGWNVILEHMLTAAVVARAWSGYLNSVSGDVIRNTTISIIGDFHSKYFGEYLDFVALFACFFIALLVALGSKASTRFNSVFTCLNLCVIIFVIAAAFSYADFSMWHDHRGFMPYGVSGILSGAGSCFFAFIGFDGLATAGEEAKKPGRAIPLATFYCMAIVTVAYILMSGSLALMVPYDKVDITAAYASAFQSHGATIARYAVSLGAICGMTTTLFGATFCLPRCVYAMAQDGLIFKWLSNVHARTQVPVNAIIVFGTLTGIMAFLVDVATLVDFLSLGTLMAYSIVAASLIVLRYRREPEEDKNETKAFRFRFLGSSNLSKISVQTGVNIALAIMVTGFVVISICFTTNLREHFIARPLVALSAFMSGKAFLWISAYRQNEAEVAFKVRFVPFIPSLSLFMNILMMINLPILAWFRFAVWMTIGMLIYLFYGMKHSVEENSATIVDSIQMTPTTKEST